MRGNTVKLTMSPWRVNNSLALFQYNYGQRLIIEGLELPETYEVHFSNSDLGHSKTMIGTSEGVDIPDEYLVTGEPIHVWVFLHVGETDGETVCHGIIPVVPRAEPTNEPPTPQQQDVITQTIAVLNAGVSEVNQIAEEIPNTINTALQEAKDSGEFNGATFIPSVSSSGVISWTNDGDLPNPSPVDLIEAVDENGYAKRSEIPTNVSQLNNDSGYLTTETDPTVPSWAKQPQKPSYTSQEVGALPADTFIPSKVSDLTNDSGYLTQETDPTVPSWAKAPTKPSYTYQEVGALPSNTFIPEKVSDLTNDAGYLSQETDPTVPLWAKTPDKPSYTASEVGLGNVANERQYSANNPPPSDNTKQDKIIASGILQGDGSGSVTAVTYGIDFGTEVVRLI